MGLTAKSVCRSSIKFRFVLSLISVLVSTCSVAMAQAEREFMDKANGFKITLAGDWRALPYTDAVGRQKTEFVWDNRVQGLLRITREDLRGSPLPNVARREIENFALCYSCVFTGQGEFSGGSLSGTRVALYYAVGNRRMVGTFYFLQDKEAVWILRFNGQAGSPAMAPEITDSMARSFCSVCALY